MEKRKSILYLHEENEDVGSCISELALGEQGDYKAIPYLSWDIRSYGDQESLELIVCEYSGKRIQTLQRIIKKYSTTTPILIITQGQNSEELQELSELSNVYFVFRPFSPVEIKFRSNLIMKRTKSKAPAPHDCQNIFKLINKIPNLTLKEYQILNLFIQSKDNMVGRESILKHVWPNIDVQPKTIDVHFHNLRKKLELHKLSIKRVKRGFWQLDSHTQMKQEMALK